MCDDPGRPQPRNAPRQRQNRATCPSRPPNAKLGIPAGQPLYTTGTANLNGTSITKTDTVDDAGQRSVVINTASAAAFDTPMLAGVTDEYRKGLEAGVPFPSRLGQPTEYAQLAQMIVEHDYLNGETCA